MSNLTAIINRRNGRTPYTYWRIGTTVSSGHQSYWETMRQENCVAIGWSELGDLSEIPNKKAGKDQIRETLLAQGTYTNPATAGRIGQQLFHFRWSISLNDLVLASNGATVLGIGRVTSSYRYS